MGDSDNRKVAVFYPRGRPFFVDEDPNVEGGALEVSCVTNYDGAKCYYYGNGD